MTDRHRILVTGAGGQVGQELVRRSKRLHVELVATERSSLDISQPDQVLEFIQANRIDLVINAAAYTAVDKAEVERSDAMAANCDGARNLATACAQYTIPMLHLSTDYVFNGEKVLPYTEQDLPKPNSVYGQSKLAGETAITKVLPQHLILRVSWVFGFYGNNFVHTMMRLAMEHPKLRVVSDQFGRPTWAGDIADTLLLLAEEVLNRSQVPWGIYHYSGEPTISWHGFAEEIFRQAVAMGKLEQAPEVAAITTEEYPTAARRPVNSALDCGLIKRTFGVEQADWRDGLSQVLREI